MCAVNLADPRIIPRGRSVLQIHSMSNHHLPVIKAYISVLADLYAHDDHGLRSDRTSLDAANFYLRLCSQDYYFRRAVPQ